MRACAGSGILTQLVAKVPGGEQHRRADRAERHPDPLHELQPPRGQRDLRPSARRLPVTTTRSTCSSTPTRTSSRGTCCGSARPREPRRRDLREQPRQSRLRQRGAPMTQALLAIVLVLAQAARPRRAPDRLLAPPGGALPGTPTSPLPPTRGPRVPPARGIASGRRRAARRRLRPRGPDPDRGRAAGRQLPLPLVGTVTAAGATTEEVEERISTAARPRLPARRAGLGRGARVSKPGRLRRRRPGSTREPTRSRGRRGSSRSCPARVRCPPTRGPRS